MTVTVRTEEPPAFVELRETFARRTQTDARDWYLVFKARYGMREVFASLRDVHGEGKVLTTLFTGCTAVDSIIAGGLAPDYAPLDRDSLEMDPDAVELVDDVRAVLLQHSYGVVQQDVCLRLREAAHAVGALFVEDSAHCLLRMARDAEGAPLADISIHSFGIEKTFSDIYFGGAIWVNPALRALDPGVWDRITRALDGLPALPARLDKNTQAYHSQVRLMVHLPGSLGTRMRERKLARGTYEPPVAEVERRGGLPYESYRPSAWIVDRIRTAIARLDDNEAQRLASRTAYDLEMLETMGFCSGIENYSRHLDGRKPGEPPYTLIDYFPRDMLCIIDESHVTVPQIRGMYEGDRSRKVTLVDHGFRLPSALDNRPLRFDEFEQRIPQFIYVSATPGDYEEKVAQQEVEQIIRPTGLLDPTVEVRPVHGQIDDLIDEIKKRVAIRERVLVTTLTKRMAEDLTDHLLDEGIRVNYMHSDTATLDRVEIIKTLREGKIDVLVGINLLREGLDIPEVSLVAILDADKEGFLRNRRSLIQTMGRGARNAHGAVIMYADVITDSMRVAIDETRRRREIQEEFNRVHGITPRTVQKKIDDVRGFIDDADRTLQGKGRSRGDSLGHGAFYTSSEGADRAPEDASEEDADALAAEIAELPRDEQESLMLSLVADMERASDEMDFERAARLRDQVVAIRTRLEGTTAEDVIDRLKRTDRKGSAHATRRRYNRHAKH